MPLWDRSPPAVIVALDRSLRLARFGLAAKVTVHPPNANKEG